MRPVETRRVRVSVVIPTLNEERNLPAVLARVPSYVHQLIVVDGRSTDATVETALRLWPNVRIVHQEGSGKGDALAAGFAAATGDIVVMLDGDGSTDPREIPRFVAALLAGADVAKGSRFIGDGGSDDLTAIRRAGTRALAGLVNLLFGTEYTDLCYGYNAMWRDCVGGLTLAKGFDVEASMNASAARAGLKVVEVPSYERERLHGVSNLRAIHDGVKILRTIVGERVRRRVRLRAAEVPATAPP